MQIRRLFIKENPSPSDWIPLSPEEFHYATRVMRLKSGDPVELINSEGCMDGVLQSVSAGTAIVRILSRPRIVNEPSVSITLFQGIPDHLEKLEFIVQKSVELGVERIVPFTSRYTDAKYRKIRITEKIERMKKISREAVRQCGRSRIPPVEHPISFLKLTEAVSGYDASFLFYEKSVQPKTKKQGQAEHIALIIGPEGGFSDKEVLELTERRCIPIHLPGRILRTETAALACLSLVQAQYGDYRDVF